MFDPYDSRLLQKLHDDVIEALNRAHTELGSGTAIVKDNAAATGMICAKYMGAIKAYGEVLKMMEHIRSEMNGKLGKKD